MLLTLIPGLALAVDGLRIGGGGGLPFRQLASPDGGTSGFEEVLAIRRPSAPFCAKAISRFASSSAYIGAIGAVKAAFPSDSGVLSILLDAAVLLLLPLLAP